MTILHFVKGPNFSGCSDATGLNMSIEPTRLVKGLLISCEIVSYNVS